MNKSRFLIVLSILILLWSNLYSQTNVSGIYFSNTTWTKSNSPYNVNGNVQIPNGVTLTIEPGCKISFSGGYEILIKGSIRVLGKDTAKIEFSGNYSSSTMLMFKSTDLSNSYINYATFIGTHRAIQLSTESYHNQDPIKNSDTLLIKNSNFTSTVINSSGIQTSAAIKIDSCIISNSKVYGDYPRSEPIKIINSFIAESIFNSDSYNYGISFDNCYITSSTFTLGCCGSNFNINKSKIINSSFSHYNDNNFLTIRNSELRNTPIDLPSTSTTIENCNFYTSSNHVFKIKNGSFKCSKIIGNGYGTAFIAGGATIVNSTFSDFSYGIMNPGSIDSCNFINVRNFLVQNYSNNAVNAKHNWWGTTDSSVIASKIFDYYDDINYDKVDFSDFLITEYTSKSCPDTLILPTPPSPVIVSHSDSKKLCSGQNSYLYVKVKGDNLNYEWFKSGNTIGNNNDTLYLYNISNADIGSYYCKVSNSFGNDSTGTISITLDNISADFSINDSGQCKVSNSFDFTNTSSNATSYQWEFGDNSSSNLTNTNHSYITSGTFVVQLIATNNLGCVDTTVKNVYVYPEPTAVFSIGNSAQCLSGNSFGFTNNSSGAATYLWDFGDNNTSTQSAPSHSFATDGTFSVKMVATSSNGCKDSVTHDLDVYPQPVATFTKYYKGNGLVKFYPDDISQLEYKWYFGDGDSSSQIIISHLYDSNKTYNTTLNVTNIYGCISVYSDTVNISNVLSISENDNVERILIYPNPTIDIIKIDLLNTKEKPKLIRIYSSDERQVGMHNLNSEEINEISLKNLSKGTYFLILDSEKNKFTKQIIKL